MRLNKTGVRIEKSVMAKPKKMKNRVGNTSTKELKKNFVVEAAWRKILHNICYIVKTFKSSINSLCHGHVIEKWLSPVCTVLQKWLDQGAERLASGSW